jgi:hypothetical protein
MTLGAVTVVSSNVAGTTGSYVANDVMGSEISFTSAVSASGGSGVIEHVVMWDDADVMAACELWFSSATASPAADSAAFAPSDANARLYVAMIALPAPTDNGLNRYVDWDGFKSINCAATTLFCTIVARATIGTIAANALRIQLSIRQDQ